MNDFFKKLLLRRTQSNFGRKLFFSVVYTILILYYLWLIPAVYFLNLPWNWLRTTLACIFALGIPAALIIFRKNKHSLWGIAGVCLFFGIWFSLIPPSNKRNWTKDVAVLPSITFNGDEVTIKNIRHFKYRGEHDFIPSYYDAVFNLNDLQGADYVLSYWDNNTLVAHSMLSFGFKDGRHICVSVETRREKGEPQTGLRGIYNQYELIYIIADESDLLLLRTNHRGEQVYVYPLHPKKPENIRKVFVEILRQAQQLEKHPQFYNTLRDNCFTTLLQDVRRVTGNPAYTDYRVLLNGLSDELGYEKGWFETGGMSFSEFKRTHHINQYVVNDPEPEKNFSKKIRPYMQKKSEKEEDKNR